MKNPPLHLRNLLLSYNSIFKEEEIAKSKMLYFIDNFENVFSRSQTHGHFTASSLLINSDNTKFLLMHHKKLDKWLQLGGHCDGNPNVQEVAVKETMEESGISEINPISSNIFDIDVHEIPANAKDNAHFHYDVRFLLKAENDNFIKNEESNELKWFELSSFNNQECNFESSIIRMIKKFV